MHRNKEAPSADGASIAVFFKKECYVLPAVILQVGKLNLIPLLYVFAQEFLLD